MKRSQKLGLLVLGLIGLGALAYANRIYVLQYSLGWYTDIRHPRYGYRETPWAQGSNSAAMPLTQRPPDSIVILADDLGINDVSTPGDLALHANMPPSRDTSLIKIAVNIDKTLNQADAR